MAIAVFTMARSQRSRWPESASELARAGHAARSFGIPGCSTVGPCSSSGKRRRAADTPDVRTPARRTAPRVPATGTRAPPSRDWISDGNFAISYLPDRESPRFDIEGSRVARCPGNSSSTPSGRCTGSDRCAERIVPGRRAGRDRACDWVSAGASAATLSRCTVRAAAGPALLRGVPRSPRAAERAADPSGQYRRTAATGERPGIRSGGISITSPPRRRTSSQRSSTTSASSASCCRRCTWQSPVAGSR